MNKILFITGLFILNMFLYSCSENFLDLSPISNANELDFYKTEKDFYAAVTAAYATLYTQYGPNAGVSQCGEQMSDEATRVNAIGLGSGATAQTVPDLLSIKNYEILPSNSVVREIWRNGFRDLHTINVVIEKLQNSSISEDKKLEYEAEMRFLRALYNFNLVRMFGDIPLLDHPVNTVAESYTLLRTPAEEVYEFIITDLKFAADYLPLQSAASRVGQATKGTAQGILGKVYLTIGNKSEASEVLLEVYNSHEYELVDNYADLWNFDKKNLKESLFEIQHVSGATTPNSPYFESFAPFENFTLTGQGHGMNQPTQALWDAYEPGDPRRDLSIEVGYINNSGNWIDVLYPAKWIDTIYKETQNSWCRNNFIVLRYADILLMLTESTDDVQYLNMVRDRVEMPEYGEPGYPAAYNTIALAVEHERQVELALEFHRWFDLKRTGRATTVLTDAKGKTITEEMLFLPIPQAERDINPLLEQNSFWQ